MHLVPVKMGDEAPRWLAERLAQYAADQVRVRRPALGKPFDQLTALPAADEFTSTESYEISRLAVAR